MLPIAINASKQFIQDTTTEHIKKETDGTIGKLVKKANPFEGGG